MAKAMIIVDFSHLFSRNLFVAIHQAQPRVKNGKYITSDITPYFKHLLFNSLQYIKNQFQGEMVLALDAKYNWRKDFYSDYKGTRAKGKSTSEINWEEIYPLVDEIVEVIQNNFPFKVVKVPKAEADDIGGVLAQEYGNDIDVTLVTSDHDWMQNITHGKFIRQYDPIKKEFSLLSDFEHKIIDTPAGKMSRFTAMHALSGDKGDNVPGLTFETKFSDNFLTFLSNNEIKSIDVKEVQAMEIFPELLEKYDIFSKVKSGKRKGENVIDYRIYYRLDNGELITKDNYVKQNRTEDFTEEEVYQKDIFKSISFGPKKIEKAVQDEASLLEVLNSEKYYMDNFKFSNTLVNFSEIPKEIQEAILIEYNEAQVNYNQNGILEYFMNEGLGKLINQVSKFYSNDAQVQNTSSLDDFF